MESYNVPEAQPDNEVEPEEPATQLPVVTPDLPREKLPGAPVSPAVPERMPAGPVPPTSDIATGEMR